MNGDQLDHLIRSLDEIKSAIIGNPELGHDGLVKKVAKHEERISRIERYVIMLGSASTVLTGLYIILRDLFISH